MLHVEEWNISNITASVVVSHYSAFELRIHLNATATIQTKCTKVCIRQNNFQRMKKSQTLSLQDQRLKNKVHESCSSSLYIGDVQRQPVIGGVNWQIQYKSRVCSLSSSPSEARSLNREWILSCCLNPWIASYPSTNIPMLNPTPVCQEEKQPSLI